MMSGGEGERNGFRWRAGKAFMVRIMGVDRHLRPILTFGLQGHFDGS
jgi:hypothetical protein